MSPDRRTPASVERDIEAAARRGVHREEIDEVLVRALEALAPLVPHELATVLEHDSGELRVRVATGPLADGRVRAHSIRLDDFPTIRRVLDEGTARAFTERDHRNGDLLREVVDLPMGHRCLAVPLIARGEILGLMTLDHRERGGYSREVVALADAYGKLLGQTLRFGEQTGLLADVVHRLERRTGLLEEQLVSHDDAATMLEASASAAMRLVVTKALQVAPTDAPVLITGETGTGKDLLAKAIHAWSPRSGQAMVGINCAALPPGLIESELFGHVRGAFTGASERRIGRLRMADEGTLFLDEVSALPTELQGKLLRVLQRGSFQPVGSDHTVHVDVRVIAATNPPLGDAVAAGTFREDLYYRLAVFPILVPPLRERQDDIPLIARSFLDRLARSSGRGPWRLGEHALAWLKEQPWPGNIRELLNVLERRTIVSTDADLDPAPADVLTPEPATTDRVDPSEPIGTLRETEKRQILRALEHTHGRIHGPDGAARLLDINASTLRSRMTKLGIAGAREFRRRRS